MKTIRRQHLFAIAIVAAVAFAATIARAADPLPSRQPELDFVDDHHGEPVGIDQYIDAGRAGRAGYGP